MLQLSHRALGLVAVLAVAACSVGELRDALNPETGEGLVYALTSVNGDGLPAVVAEGNTTLEIRKGALTLSSDSSWILSYTVRATGGGANQTTLNTLRGVYSLASTALTLKTRDSLSTQFSGTFSPVQVSLTDATVAQGDVLLFNR